MEFINRNLSPLRRLTKPQLLLQVTNLGLVVCSALMIWKSLMVASGCESPVVVVLSGSMMPAFYRGDIIFTTMDDTHFQVGEVVIFKVEGKPVPIVHRIIKIHEKEGGTAQILTKGDNNEVDDFQGGIYAPNQQYITREDIIGRPKAYMPYVGWITIMVYEIPYFKFILIGSIGLFALTTRE